MDSLLYKGANVLFSIILVKKLTIEKYADYGILISILTIISLITYMGLPNLLQRYLPEYYLEDKTKIFLYYINTIYIRIMAISLVLIIFFFLIHFQLFSNFKVPNILFISFCLFAMSRALLSHFLETMNAIKKQKWILYIRSIWCSVEILTLILILWLQSFTLDKVFIIFGFGELGMILTSIILLKIQDKISYKYFRPNFRVFKKEEIKYSFYTYLSQIQHIFVNQSYDVLIVALILNKTFVAYYTFAHVFSGTLLGFLPLDPLQQALMPEMIQDFKRNQSYKILINQLKKINHFITAMYLPIIVLIVINADIIIKYFGKSEYENAKYLLVGLVLIKFTIFLSSTTKKGLIILERAKDLFYSNLIFILQPLIVFICIKFVGLYGTLISASFVNFGILFLREYFLHKRLKETIFDGKFFKLLFQNLIILLILFSLHMLYPNWMITLVSQIIYLLVLIYLIRIHKWLPVNVTNGRLSIKWN